MLEIINLWIYGILASTYKSMEEVSVIESLNAFDDYFAEIN